MIGIGGEQAMRLYKEVVQEGKFLDAADTPQEAEHRARLVRALKIIDDAGAMVDIPKEWL